MTWPSEHIAVGPLLPRLGYVSALLYLDDAEIFDIPEPIKPGENASDERVAQYDAAMVQWNEDYVAWQMQPVDVDHSAVWRRNKQFLIGLDRLVNALSDINDLHQGMVEAGIKATEDRPLPWNETDIQSLFYEHAKLTFGTEKADIREFFRTLYLIIFGKPSGSRWGQFASLTGYDGFMDVLERRMCPNGN